MSETEFITEMKEFLKDIELENRLNISLSCFYDSLVAIGYDFKLFNILKESIQHKINKEDIKVL